MEVVVLDFETTGLSCERHRVIEVGAARIDSSGKISATFQQLCNPGMKVSKFITSFTGISNEMLVGKPSPEEVMSELFDFIGKTPIVAHNASFDSQFLVAEMNRIGKKVHNLFLCTLLLSRRMLKDAKSFKLSNLKKFINFQADGDHCDHRALDDVLVTVKLWNVLNEVIRLNIPHKPVNIGTIQAISKLTKKRASEVFKITPFNASSHMPTVPDDERKELYRYFSSKQTSSVSVAQHSMKGALTTKTSLSSSTSMGMIASATVNATANATSTCGPNVTKSKSRKRPQRTPGTGRSKRRIIESDPELPSAATDDAAGLSSVAHGFQDHLGSIKTINSLPNVPVAAPAVPMDVNMAVDVTANTSAVTSDAIDSSEPNITDMKSESANQPNQAAQLKLQIQPQPQPQAISPGFVAIDEKHASEMVKTVETVEILEIVDSGDERDRDEVDDEPVLVKCVRRVRSLFSALVPPTAESPRAHQPTLERYFTI